MTINSNLVNNADMLTKQGKVRSLGTKGDGLVETETGYYHVPFTLPDEEVLIKIVSDQSDKKYKSAQLYKILKPSPERREPFCPFFSRCGGCIAQHMSEACYTEWKEDHIKNLFAREHIRTHIHPMINAGGDGRRRVTYHVRFKPQPGIGFMELRSHKLIEITSCPILEKKLEDSPKIAFQLAQVLKLLEKPLDLVFLTSETGLDVDIRGAGKLPERLRLKLSQLCQELNLARISNHGEVIIERVPPVLTMGSIKISPPCGSFVQATRYAEETIAHIIASQLKKTKRVADLFSGCGPFALYIAQSAQVHAVEGEASMITSLDKAVRNNKGLKRVTTEIRDLFRRPLLISELNEFDMVVLDPPRSGASAQCEQIAKSQVPNVIMVSCDETSFTRDAHLLTSGEYQLQEVHLIDQFRYSAHIELVGIFNKKVQRKRR